MTPLRHSNRLGHGLVRVATPSGGGRPADGRFAEDDSAAIEAAAANPGLMQPLPGPARLGLEPVARGATKRAGATRDAQIAEADRHIKRQVCVLG
jgi:hypothetical protein